MLNLHLIWSVILWFFKAASLVLIDIFTYIFSFVICLFVTKKEESEVTGFPSMLPGKPREFLVKPLIWFQSTDAPLDEFWYGDYPHKLKTKYDQAYYDTHWWLRYRMRLSWLWRNPAYGFGTRMGFLDRDIVMASVSDNEKDWKSGKNVSSHWIFTNSDGGIGWCYRAQFYYYKTHCLEMYLGYKILGDTIKNRKLVAMQWTPFRSYP